MHPILLSGAVSLAGDLVRNVADKFGKSPEVASPEQAAKANFPAMLDKVAAAKSSANIAATRQTLKHGLTHSREVAAAINEVNVAGPFQLQVDATGKTTLRGPAGQVKEVNLDERTRASARELFALESRAVQSSPSAGPNFTTAARMQSVTIAL